MSEDVVADDESPGQAERSCPFCALILNDAPGVVRRGSVVTIPDAFPVTDGRTLIAPVRHVHDFFEMDGPEVRDLYTTLHRLRAELQNSDHEIAGFNIGVNCGRAAGQTIAHAHVHLIPRRPGDTPRPRGGVRGVIPEQMDY